LSGWSRRTGGARGQEEEKEGSSGLTTCPASNKKLKPSGQRRKGTPFSEKEKKRKLPQKEKIGGFSP